MLVEACLKLHGGDGLNCLGACRRRPRILVLRVPVYEQALQVSSEEGVLRALEEASESSHIARSASSGNPMQMVASEAHEDGRGRAPRSPSEFGRASRSG